MNTPKSYKPYHVRGAHTSNTATVQNYTRLVYSGTNSPVDKTEQKSLFVTVTPWHERCSLQLSPHGVTVTKSDYYVSEIRHATFIPGAYEALRAPPFFF